jgi:hypothetical protein
VLDLSGSGFIFVGTSQSSFPPPPRFYGLGSDITVPLGFCSVHARVRYSLSARQSCKQKPHAVLRSGVFPLSVLGWAHQYPLYILVLDSRAEVAPGAWFSFDHTVRILVRASRPVTSVPVLPCHGLGFRFSAAPTWPSTGSFFSWFLLIEQWIFLARACYCSLFLPLVLLLIFSGKNLSLFQLLCAFPCIVLNRVLCVRLYTNKVFCRRPAAWLRVYLVEWKKRDGMESSYFL